MHHGMGVFSSIFNFMIIYFVIMVVIKAAKKKKKSDGQSSQTDPYQTPGKETVIVKQTHPKDLKYENKPIFNENMQLKRCPNCGGEIPLTMMKCELCGKRQTGCSAVIWILILLLAFGVLFLFLEGNGVPLKQYLTFIIDKLAGY
jgi:hypothetical protein